MLRLQRNGSVLAFFAIILLVGGGLWHLSKDRSSHAHEKGALVLHCAAGIKKPIKELADLYEKRHGIRVQLDYGGSGTLLSKIRIKPDGDLYVAGDDSYTDQAREQGLVAERLPLARMQPVLAFAKSNPKGIARLQDLLRDDVRIAYANPEAAAVGRLTRKLLTKAGIWEPIESRKSVTKPTVTELANDLVIGAIDAAIIWDATARQYPELSFVAPEEFVSATKHVTLGVLSASKRPTAALRFARFLASSDIGMPVFARHGFVPESNDPFAETPELLLMAGAMLNAAVDDTIAAFEKREGCRITRIYNGCGILVSQMRAGETPDAYFSCDVSFLEDVQQRFDDGVVVAENDMVILVAEGNPKGIAGLVSLCKPGLRVGLAHPEKSALGALTHRMLRRAQLESEFAQSGNLEVESATGDFLVNQIRTGSLDATIVYRSNAAMAQKHLDIVEIEQEGALAAQPWALAKDTPHRRMLQRLYEALTTTASRAQFEGLGFRWRLGEVK